MLYSRICLNEKRRRDDRWIRVTDGNKYRYIVYYVNGTWIESGEIFEQRFYEDLRVDSSYSIYVVGHNNCQMSHSDKRVGKEISK